MSIRSSWEIIRHTDELYLSSSSYNPLPFFPSIQEKKKRDEMNASHLGQFLDKEVEQLWIAGGMAAIKEYPDFWREYCFERYGGFFGEHVLDFQL